MKSIFAKHQYAYDIHLKVNVDIKDVKVKSEYICISCKNEMIPKMGKKNIHHFAHKSNTINCSYETYLHKLAKETFYSEYLKCLNESLPFYIEYLNIRACSKDNVEKTQNCNGLFVGKKFDITKTFTNIDIEKRDNNFIPDITLSNDKGQKIYIEIAVTHKCEENKINFGVRIIELQIKTEDDVKQIFDHFIPFIKDKIFHYNFKMNLENNLCEECNVWGHSFKIFKSKKGLLLNYISLKEHVTKNINSLVYSHFYLSDDNYYQDDYFEEIWDAYEKDNSIIKDCNLCKYHGYVERGKGNIFCKLNKKYTNPQVAVYCTKFRVMKNRYKKL